MAGSGGRLFGMLVEHGIPERSARIYLAACRRPPQSAAELARASGTNRAEAYRFIRQLEISGLVRSTGHRPARFAALPPEALLERWVRAATERLHKLESDRDRTVSELEEGLMDISSPDPHQFTVIEGTEPIFRHLARRIGAARREIDWSIPGPLLSRAMDGAVVPALRAAAKRGVTVRVVTEVTLQNRGDAKSLSGFTELRHSDRPITNRCWSIDRREAVSYIAGPTGVGLDESEPVAVWSVATSFRRLTEAYLRRLWVRSVPFEQRIVGLEAPESTPLDLAPGNATEAFERLRDVASLGMRASGLEKLPLQFSDLIDALGAQIGLEISKGIEGETPVEIARSLVGHYREHAVGRLEITSSRPLALKVSGCFACTSAHSPEIGRRLCPAILKTVLETRSGSGFSVSRPDPSRHAQRGCRFTVTPN